MKKIIQLGLIATLVLCLVSCRSSSKMYHTFETECLGVELDGSQTLKAWGTGRYWLDATEQARKNAVRDVIFKGRFAGSAECHQNPLLMEVNAQSKYESYFNAFFRDGGEFHSFVTLQDERVHKRFMRTPTVRNRDQSKFSVIVRVDRVGLREKLIRDGILTQ